MCSGLVPAVENVCVLFIPVDYLHQFLQGVASPQQDIVAKFPIAGWRVWPRSNLGMRRGLPSGADSVVSCRSRLYLPGCQRSVLVLFCLPVRFALAVRLRGGEDSCVVWGANVACRGEGLCSPTGIQSQTKIPHFFPLGFWRRSVFNLILREVCASRPLT